MAIVVATGRAIITNRLKNGATGATEPNYVHWGTGVTAESDAQTALVTPSSEARVAGTSSQQTTTTANDTYRVIGTLTASGGARAITEAGLFDAVSSGNMFCRALFSVINIADTEQIEFTFNIKFQ